MFRGMSGSRIATACATADRLQVLLRKEEAALAAKP